MNLFPRKAKTTPGAFYFGEYDDVPLAPFSISIATFDESFAGEKKHYHSENQKVFVTLEGEGILNVDGKDVALQPEMMVHVEPNEVHHVSQVTKAPLKFLVITSAKVDDKVSIDK